MYFRRCADFATLVVCQDWIPAAMTEEILLGVFTLWLVHHFAMKNTSIVYLTSVYISWYV